MIQTFRAALRATLTATAFAVTFFAPCTARAANIATEQELVDRATLAAQGILSDAQEGRDVRDLLPRAKAVMICPRVFRLGIILGGGQGGGCVLVARGAQGSWSAPAFYSMKAGSFGPQLGIQDAEIFMMILTRGGLHAVMDNQFKLGADASVALITLGAGIEGATTTALNADIVAFARTRGLFAGITLQGSIMSAEGEDDETYYGQPVGTVDIVTAMRVNNPAADPLRAVLMRYGTPAPAPAPAPGYPPPQPYSQGAPPEAPVYGEQKPYVPPAGTAQAPVEQQSLPPPR